MKPDLFYRLPLLSLLLLCACLEPGLADGLNNNEVEFTGTIASVAVNGEGTGTLFVRISDFDLRVIVNSKTELWKGEKETRLPDLAVGSRVEITGKYSSSGVLASAVRILGAADASSSGFELRGRITGLKTSGGNLEVTLLGITVVVGPNLKLEEDDAQIPASDLKVGMFVHTEGTITGTIWTATSFEVVSEGKKRNEKVRFEGTVQSIAANKESITVAAEGVADSKEHPTTVHLTSNTRVIGDLAKEAVVLVIGVLDADLGVTATEIRVLQALEIKPDERKLKFGETAIFTVKLRETATIDTVIALSSSDSTKVSLPKATVTVSKGTKTAEFTAVAGNTAGTATITATLSPGQTATAEIMVGAISEDENERPAGQTRIAFAPDKMKMGLNEMRDVVLLVKPPQQTAINVEIKASNDLVKILETRELGQGAAELKLKIQSGAKEGSSSVVATLPAALGGGKAELLVEISAAKPGQDDHLKAQIEFHPDQIKLAQGDSRTVNLMLSRSYDKDVTVGIKAVTGSDIVTVPPAVTISAGSKVTKLTILGKATGNANIVAALPDILGGDTAELGVEVTARK